MSKHGTLRTRVITHWNMLNPWPFEKCGHSKNIEIQWAYLEVDELCEYWSCFCINYDNVCSANKPFQLVLRFEISVCSSFQFIVSPKELAPQGVDLASGLSGAALLLHPHLLGPKPLELSVASLGFFQKMDLRILGAVEWIIPLHKSLHDADWEELGSGARWPHFHFAFHWSVFHWRLLDLTSLQSVLTSRFNVWAGSDLKAGL